MNNDDNQHKHRWALGTPEWDAKRELLITPGSCACGASRTFDDRTRAQPKPDIRGIAHQAPPKTRPGVFSAKPSRADRRQRKAMAGQA